MSENRLHFQILRSDRTKIAIQILPDGTVLVRAPHHVPEADICALVKEQSAWILRSQAKLKAQHDQRAQLPPLTGEDIKNQTQFDDCIAQACYQIDIHGPTDASSKLIQVPQGRHYDVPYRSLVPVSCDNLLVAGRCVSATHEALAAIRVQPICMAMGQAAGTAAAMCVKENVTVPMLDTSALRTRLREQNAIVD